MEEQQHSLDEIFRESLGDYREAPPAAAWDKVAARLDADDRNRKKGFFWWPWLVLALLLTMGGGWFLAAKFNTHPKAEEVSTEQTAAENGGNETDFNPPASSNAEGNTTNSNHSNSIAANLNAEKPVKPAVHSPAQTEQNALPQTEKSNPDNSIGSDNSSAKTNSSQKIKKEKNSYDLQNSKEANSTETADKLSNSRQTEAAEAKPANAPKQNQTSTAKNAIPVENRNSTGVSENQTDKKTIAKSNSTKNSTPKVSATASNNSSDNGNREASANTSDETGQTKSKNSTKANDSKPLVAAAATNSNNTPKPGKQTTGNSNQQKPKETAGNTNTNNTKDAATTTSRSAEANSSRPAETVAGIPPAKTEASANAAATPLPRKAIEKMTASSPSFEEAKAKDDIVPPAPVAQAETKATSTPDTTAGEVVPDNEEEPAGKGGEGSGSGGDEKTRKKPSFSLALQGGYEFAMQKPAPNQVTGGFRLLWHFDPKISVGIQPSIRYGDVTSKTLSSQAYQRSSEVTVDSLIGKDSTGFVYYRAYFPKQTFDSIVVAGLKAGGPIWQLEIPIILNYKIGTGWYAYGGPSIHLGGKLSHSNGDMQTYTTKLSDTLLSPPGTVQAPRPPSSFEGYFGTSSLPQYSTYNPAESSWKDPASLRFGYLIGVGYEHKRFLFDVSLHQQVTGFSDVLPEFKQVYSSPYIRLSLGYMILPQRKK